MKDREMTALEKYLKSWAIKPRDFYNLLRKKTPCELKYGSFLHVLYGRHTTVKNAIAIIKTANYQLNLEDLIDIE